MDLRRIIMHNFGWKVVSIILASLIWVTVDSGLQNRLHSAGVRSFARLPITVMRTAGDERVFRVEPSNVEVVVSGEADLLQSLHPGDIQVFVNLTELTEAKVWRKRIQVHPPPNISVVRVRPAEVVVQVVVVPVSPKSKI